MSALPATIDRGPAAPAVGPAAVAYAHDAMAASTWDGYRRDWRTWTRWCEEHGRVPLPGDPADVCDYIAHEADRGLRPATIDRRLAAIAALHGAAAVPSPTGHPQVRLVMAGVRRCLGADQRRVAPVTVPVLTKLVLSLDVETHAGVRDRALLLLGFAAALRRSELAALRVSDVASCDEGLRVRVRKSKTDQAGAGATIGVPFGSTVELCPVAALDAWLTAVKAHERALDGPLLLQVDRHDVIRPRGLSGRAVAEVVKRACARAGVDPADYSGHSLRAGLVTAAAAAGVAEVDIARTTRHKSVPVLRRYVREASVFTRNAAGAVL